MKYTVKSQFSKAFSLPPCGGSGLKCETGKLFRGKRSSPSVWREWIEMLWLCRCAASGGGLPPCGGSGLKYQITVPVILDQTSPSVWREWIEIAEIDGKWSQTMSPSVWREWIEMYPSAKAMALSMVSLRVEGVD